MSNCEFCSYHKLNSKKGGRPGNEAAVFIMFLLHVYLLQKFMMELLPAPDLKITRGNLMLQKALLLVQYNMTIPAPLQVRGLSSHRLGVDVASAHSLAL